MPAATAPSAGLIPTITFVLWTGCLLVGAIGFAFPYARPQPPAPPPPALTVEKLTVELTNDPLPAPSTPQPLAALPQPDAPQPLAVAAPSPALAFQLPVASPVRSVPATAPATATPATPAPKQLTFGRGEGRQPAPTYPSSAVRQGQEGTATVRFSVDETGHVTTVEIASSSLWPLLDEAALRAVRDRWHFAPGATRTYDVAIRFSLQK